MSLRLSSLSALLSREPTTCSYYCDLIFSDQSDGSRWDFELVLREREEGKEADRQDRIPELFETHSW